MFIIIVVCCLFRTFSFLGRKMRKCLTPDDCVVTPVGYFAPARSGLLRRLALSEGAYNNCCLLSFSDIFLPREENEKMSNPRRLRRHPRGVFRSCSERAPSSPCVNSRYVYNCCCFFSFSDTFPFCGKMRNLRHKFTSFL